MNSSACDSSYNGINLLNNNNLTVVFNETNTSSLEDPGRERTSPAGLGLNALNNNEFQDDNSINNVITNINDAITTVLRPDANVRLQFGNHLDPADLRAGTPSTRCRPGSSNLVLADQNEESADLLTVQTQQQLEISALSIANQANQSVLKLFP